jgi:hypothetical protein
MASAPFAIASSPLPPLPPPPPPPPRTSPRASRRLDAELPAVASSRDHEVIATPPGGIREDASPEVTEPVRARPRLRPRSWAKSTQRTRPDPRSPAALVPSIRAEPEEPGTVPSSERVARPIAHRGRGVVWLILLMLALGSGAMAAAYFWPDL